MLADLIRPDVAELIRNRNFNELREFLLELPVPDLAELLADSSPEDRAVLFRLLPRELAAETFEYLPFEAQEELLKGLATSRWCACSTTCGRTTARHSWRSCRARSRRGCSTCSRRQSAPSRGRFSAIRRIRSAA